MEIEVLAKSIISQRCCPAMGSALYAGIFYISLHSPTGEFILRAEKTSAIRFCPFCGELVELTLKYQGLTQLGKD